MLKGSWACTSCQNDGRDIPDATRDKLRLELTDSIYRTSVGEQMLFEGQYTVNERVHPKEMDILATSGPFEGQSALGIFELSQKDELRLAYVMPGKTRPGEFKSIAGSGVANTVWKRLPLDL